MTPISQKSNNPVLLTTNQTVIDEDENEQNTSSVIMQKEGMPREFEVENAPSDK